MKSVVAILLIVAVVACNAARLLHADNPNAIQGHYIVVMKNNVMGARDAHIMNIQDAMLEANDGSRVKHVYRIGSFFGYSAELSEDFLKRELAHPDVDFIEADQIMTASYLTQTNPPSWGLPRLSTRKNGASDFFYNSTQGEGVDVYIIDTGIYTDNADFEGRASVVFNAITNEPSVDLNGHGTHCSGTIGGAAYGVAKKATLKGVKVLSKQGSGTNAGVIAGVDYVTNQRSKDRPTVASMSLGGGVSTALDKAVTNSIASGVVYAVAAGNENYDACYSSPARVPDAVTVGATDSNDNRASFSNYGKCVDIFAPGVKITSDWMGSPNATNTISGTSMATPHVAGVLALHLSSDPSLTPAQSKDWLRATATPDIVGNANSANFLLYAPAI